MSEQEKSYDLANSVDRKHIIDLLVAMGPNQTLTFLLTEQPAPNDYGKVCIRAGVGRSAQTEVVHVELKEEVGLGLVLFATCALPETEEDDGQN